MDKPTHFHTGVSGLIRFVTLDGNFTSDGYQASTVDLTPLKIIVGTKVRFNDFEGIVRQTLTDNPEISQGKYTHGHYCWPSDNAAYNQYVGVYWYKMGKKGMLPYWFPVFELEFYEYHNYQK